MLHAPDRRRAAGRPARSQRGSPPTTPDRLERLILVVPFGLAPFQPTPAFGAALTGYLTQPSERTHEELWNQCVFDLEGLRRQPETRWDQLKAYNLELAGSGSAGAAIQTLMDAFGWAAVPDDVLARIVTPTSLIWGRHDSIVPLAVGEAASSRYGWPLRVIENAGNEPAYEVPDAFIQALRELAGQRREGTSRERPGVRRDRRRGALRRLARRRCCSPAAVTGCSCSTGRSSRATRSRRISSIRPGIESLERWGLLDTVLATGIPPIDTYAFDFGPFTISGAPGTDETPCAYAPRRTVLDKLLVDAAADAGAEVRERFVVESLVMDGDRVAGIRGHGKGGKTVTEQAAVVIGADGRNSLVADAVGAEEYHEKPRLQVSYYTYWSGLPMDGRFETAVRPGLGFAAWPTHDDLTLVIAGRPIDEFDAVRQDVEGSYHEVLEIAPAFAERVRAAKREERFLGTAVRELLPQALRPGLGAGRRRGLQQGLHHGSGHPRRLPRRRVVRRGARCVVRGRRQLRGRDAGVSGAPRRAGPADVRVHGRPRDARAALTRAAAGDERRQREPGRDGRVRARHRRSDVAGRVLLGRERRTHPGRRFVGLQTRPSAEKEPAAGASRSSAIGSADPDRRLATCEDAPSAEVDE